MRPKTELGNFFVENSALMEEQRLGAIAAQLDRVDTYLNTLESLEGTPLVVYRLANNSYSFDDPYYKDIFRGGSVGKAHITPAYDGYFSEENPGMVIGSRCLRVQIKPKKATPFSRKPLPPAATFYMFGQQADLAEHHIPKDTVNATESTEPQQQDPDGPPIKHFAEPTLDQSRFPLPQVGAYQFGIVRRSGTVVCFSITSNESLNTIDVPKIESGNDHVLDMMPEAVTIDRNPEKLEPLDITGKLCGDILRDLQAIAALQAPEKRRSWRSLFLKKVVVHPDNKDQMKTTIAGIPDPETSTPKAAGKPKDAKEK